MSAVPHMSGFIFQFSVFFNSAHIQKCFPIRKQFELSLFYIFAKFLIMKMKVKHKVVWRNISFNQKSFLCLIFLIWLPFQSMILHLRHLKLNVKWEVSVNALLLLFHWQFTDNFISIPSTIIVQVHWWLKILWVARPNIQMHKILFFFKLPDFSLWGHQPRCGIWCL